MRLTARVPATSANLGPGFDCFGLALDLCNEVTIDSKSEPGVSWEGEGADELPTDGTDLVSRAMRSVAEEADEEYEPFRLHGVNRIPLERGLGSSAAAAVAGISLGRRWLGLPDEMFADLDVARAAAKLDGHADNVVTATHGGLTVVTEGIVRRFDVPDAISPLALIPSIRLSTQRAREVLPEEVRRADAVFNVAHGALVIHALVTGDLDLLRVALRDRLHQQARLAMVPPVRAVFEELERSLPVCVSGAGPSLLAFTASGDPAPDPGDGWRVLRVPVRSTGVEIFKV
ncbi:MAG: homoserine kinase [Actinobacteria bacterium]|nr:homoserine kinase [Actinomycetota bacterium]